MTLDFKDVAVQIEQSKVDKVPDEWSTKLQKLHDKIRDLEKKLEEANQREDVLKCDSEAMHNGRDDAN